MIHKQKIDDSQHKITLEFHNTELERLFVVDHARQMLGQIRVALLIASFIYAIFALVDFIVVPEGHWKALFIRFVFAIPIFLLGYFATFRSYFRKRLQLLVGIIICLAGLGIALISLSYENTRSDLYLTGTLLPLYWAFLYSGLRFINAVKTSLVLIIIYEILFIQFSDLSLAILTTYNFFLIASMFIGILGGYTIECYYRRDFINKKLLRLEKQDNQKLLLNIFPAHIVKELISTGGTVAKDYQQITVLFTDLVGFSSLSRQLSANELVTMLNDIFSLFDGLIDNLELEKIKTIGDAYMVTSNLQHDQENSAHQVMQFAIEIQKLVEEYNHQSGQSIRLRTGMHSGSAVAGVIGVKKFVYDVWGYTVNIASRMESECPINRIQVSEDAYQLLASEYQFEDRGFIQIKGFDNMRTYLLKQNND